MFLLITFAAEPIDRMHMAIEHEHMNDSELPDVMVITRKDVPMLAHEIAKHLTKELGTRGVDGNDMLTRAEATAMLGISAATMTNWIKREILAPIYIGNKSYFMREEIEAMLTPIKKRP